MGAARSTSPYIFNLQAVKSQRKTPSKHQQTIYYFYSQFKIQYSFITSYKFYGTPPPSPVASPKFNITPGEYEAPANFRTVAKSIFPPSLSAKYPRYDNRKIHESRHNPPRFGRSGPRGGATYREISVPSSGDARRRGLK